MLGFGYAAPFLAGLDGAARTRGADAGAAGRAAAGRRTAAARTALVREDELPLADGSIDRVLLVHALECCSNVPRLMREVWRVLADGGRMVAVVPNRRGLWCLSDRTPFGHGQPYSLGQLQRTLDGHLFTPCAERTALFLPPTQSRLLLRLAVPAERLGLGFARQFAGRGADRGREADLCRHRDRRRSAAAGARRYVPVMEGLAAARDAGEKVPPATAWAEGDRRRAQARTSSGRVTDLARPLGRLRLQFGRPDLCALQCSSLSRCRTAPTAWCYLARWLLGMLRRSMAAPCRSGP